MSEVAVEKKTIIAPFTVEADNPRNCDLYIQVLGVKMRSAIKPTKEVFTKEDGEMTLRPTSAKIIEGLPRDLPGQRLRVNPEKLTWSVSDPLRDDQDTLDKVQRAIKSQTSLGTRSRLRGVPTVDGVLGVDEMKTLMKEIICLLDAGDVRIVKGVLPTIEDVNKLPGRYLLNWSNRGQWNQPRYEDELESWKQKLNRIG